METFRTFRGGALSLGWVQVEVPGKRKNAGFEKIALPYYTHVPRPASIRNDSEPPPAKEAVPWHVLTRARLVRAGDAAGLKYYLDEIAHELDCRYRRYAWVIVGDSRKVLPVLAERFPRSLGGG